MSYRDDLIEAGNVLVQMLREKEEHEVRIAKQKKIVAALAELCAESEFADQVFDLDLDGISDAARTVMRSSRKQWLNTGEIKCHLEELGFPIRQYSAPIATISTVLKRMADNKEVVIQKRGAYLAYKWVGPSLRIQHWMNHMAQEIRSHGSSQK